MPLRILLLDDNQDDRVLSGRELRRAFPDVEITEGADRTQFEQAMEHLADFDIVVTDFQMRWSTGMEVLQRVKARLRELPVIMFTATGTQEIAVEAMKSGLDDYVIKSPRHYVRLAVAVRTCLDRGEIRARAIRSEKRLQDLLDHISLGVIRVSLEGKLVDANRAYRLMAGLAPDATLQDHVHPLLDAVRQHLAELTQTLASAETDVELQPEGGPRRHFTLRLLRVRVNGHDAVDVLVEDTTRLREADEALRDLNANLEQRVAKRTRQLQEANEALEAFGVSISHDLREPLRTIQGYARALREDFAAGDHASCLKYIGRIEQITGAVDGMVADLLEFSRLSREDLKAESVPLERALADAAAALAYEPAFAAAQRQVEGAGGLAVRANAATLVQVLVNLLSNAAKFTSPGEPARIAVTCERVDDRVRVSVQDRGIGIAVADQARIFRVFERLHAQESYPGTGVGLAIVKKAVERMGGTVGVESSPGQGARFWIELPGA